MEDANFKDDDHDIKPINARLWNNPLNCSFSSIKVPTQLTAPHVKIFSKFCNELI